MTYDDKDSVEQQLGRPVMVAKVCSSDKTFVAFHEAETYCKDLGFSVGRMCCPEPIGVKRGDWDIAKWRNLSTGDRQAMDGAIVGDMRDGPVTVLLAAHPLEILAQEADDA